MNDLSQNLVHVANGAFKRPTELAKRRFKFNKTNFPTISPSYSSHSRRSRSLLVSQSSVQFFQLMDDANKVIVPTAPSNGTQNTKATIDAGGLRSSGTRLQYLDSTMNTTVESKKTSEPKKGILKRLASRTAQFGKKFQPRSPTASLFEERDAPLSTRNNGNGQREDLDHRELEESKSKPKVRFSFHDPSDSLESEGAGSCTETLHVSTKSSNIDCELATEASKNPKVMTQVKLVEQPSSTTNCRKHSCSSVDHGTAQDGAVASLSKGNATDAGSTVKIATTTQSSDLAAEKALASDVISDINKINREASFVLNKNKLCSTNAENIETYPTGGIVGRTELVPSSSTSIKIGGRINAQHLQTQNGNAIEAKFGGPTVTTKKLSDCTTQVVLQDIQDTFNFILFRSQTFIKSLLKLNDTTQQPGHISHTSSFSKAIPCASHESICDLSKLKSMEPVQRLSRIFDAILNEEKDTVIVVQKVKEAIVDEAKAQQTDTNTSSEMSGAPEVRTDKAAILDGNDKLFQDYIASDLQPSTVLSLLFGTLSPNSKDENVGMMILKIKNLLNDVKEQDESSPKVAALTHLLELLMSEAEERQSKVSSVLPEVTTLSVESTKDETVPTSKTLRDALKKGVVNDKDEKKLFWPRNRSSESNVTGQGCLSWGSDNEGPCMIPKETKVLLTDNAMLEPKIISDSYDVHRTSITTSIENRVIKIDSSTMNPSRESDGSGSVSTLSHEMDEALKEAAIERSGTSQKTGDRYTKSSSPNSSKETLNTPIKLEQKTQVNTRRQKPELIRNNRGRQASLLADEGKNADSTDLWTSSSSDIKRRSKSRSSDRKNQWTDNGFNSSNSNEMNPYILNEHLRAQEEIKNELSRHSAVPEVWQNNRLGLHKTDRSYKQNKSFHTRHDENTQLEYGKHQDMVRREGDRSKSRESSLSILSDNNNHNNEQISSLDMTTDYGKFEMVRKRSSKVSARTSVEVDMKQTNKEEPRQSKFETKREEDRSMRQKRRQKSHDNSNCLEYGDKGQGSITYVDDFIRRRDNTRDVQTKTTIPVVSSKELTGFGISSLNSHHDMQYELTVYPSTNCETNLNSSDNYTSAQPIHQRLQGLKNEASKASGSRIHKETIGGTEFALVGNNNTAIKLQKKDQPSKRLFAMSPRRKQHKLVDPVNEGKVMHATNARPFLQKFTDRLRSPSPMHQRKNSEHTPPVHVETSQNNGNVIETKRAAVAITASNSEQIAKIHAVQKYLTNKQSNRQDIPNKTTTSLPHVDKNGYGNKSFVKPEVKTSGLAFFDNSMIPYCASPEFEAQISDIKQTLSSCLSDILTGGINEEEAQLEVMVNGDKLTVLDHDEVRQSIVPCQSDLVLRNVEDELQLHHSWSW